MSDLPALSYFRPRRLDEALAALARPGACVYAGGTDLLVALTERRPWTSFVREIVDIKHLDAAREVRPVGDGLRIGALVTGEELAASARVRRAAPALAEAAGLTSAPALRRRGTVGGNITTPHPAGDVTTALLALDATVEVADGSGARTLPLAEFMVEQHLRWPRQQLILAVTVRRCRRSAFEKVGGSRAAFSRSVVAVSVAGVGRDVRVALGGVGPRPFLAPATAAALAGGGDVAAALADECRPPADERGPAAYRLRLAAVLLRRAGARIAGA